MVLASLELGWELADLYAGSEAASLEPAPPTTLPRLDELSAAQRGQAGITKVGALIGRALGKGPDLEPLRRALAGGSDLDPLRRIEATDQPAWRPAVYQLHLQLVASLESRGRALSDAYEVGRSLADLSRDPQDLSSLIDRLEPHRLLPIEGRLADLSSKLPAHAGAAVAATLEQWRQWTIDARARENLDGVRGALSRQRALWRALLSSEKEAREMLDPDTLVAASVRHASRLATMIRGLIGAYLPALVALGVAVFLVLYVIIDRTGIATVIAALGALTATMIAIRHGLGLTVQATIQELRAPLWAAELDAAVAQSILRLPPALAAEPRPKLTLASPEPPQAGTGERRGLAQRVERALHVTTSARRQGFRVPASGPPAAAPSRTDEDAGANGNHVP